MTGSLLNVHEVEADAKRVRELFADGTISNLDPSSFRISLYEVVVIRNNSYKYGILRIPLKLRQNREPLLILDYFTTEHYVSTNIAASSKDRIQITARNFLDFLEKKHEELTPLSLAITSYYRTLKESQKTEHTINSHISILKRIFKHAIHKIYPKSSETPSNIKKILKSLDSIKSNKNQPKKKPPLGPYLGISHQQFTNKELLMGMRLGTIWLLQKLHGFRQDFRKAPAIQIALNNCEGLTISELSKTLVCASYKLSRVLPTNYVSKASVEHWITIQKNPLLTEWQFYDPLALSRYSLTYTEDHQPKLFDETARDLMLSRFIDLDTPNLRTTAKGHGQKDMPWRVFRQVYRAARNTNRTSPIMWGVYWITHTPLEKVLFVWLLATERIQSAGIKKLTIPCIEADGEKPKTLQLTSLKLRKVAHKNSTQHAEVKSSIYKRKNPPFQVYLNWKSTCINAKSTISGYNPDSSLIVNPGTALVGKLDTDNHVETHTPLRLLITDGTLWRETFLSENASNCREALAFIEILKTRLIPSSRPNKLLCLPPDPINQSLVVEKEIESNHSETFSEINSQIAGHTIQTAKKIYKDGFLSAEVAELVDPLNIFIRRVGEERYRTALKLSELLTKSSCHIGISELKEISGVADTACTIDDLIGKLRDEDKLLITGEIQHNAQKIIVETDFTAAIMLGYLTNLENSLPSLILSERTDSTTRILAQFIHLSQTFESFSANTKRTGKNLLGQLNLKFPPVF